MSAALISCAIVYERTSDNSRFQVKESMAFTVEIICGNGTKEVSGTGFIVNNNGPVVLSNSHVVITGRVETKISEQSSSIAIKNINPK